jgi:hypothetical protein
MFPPGSSRKYSPMNCSPNLALASRVTLFIQYELLLLVLPKIA